MSIPAFFIFCVASHAQLNVSTIRGTATDPTGAVVANVDVALVSLETGAKRMTKTNDAGEYEIPDLPRGTYRLTATAAGFQTFVADNIILEGNQIRRIEIALELGGVASEVTVKADAAVISTDTPKIQATFTQQRFADAPWVGDGRNPQMVMNTLPLVQMTSGIYGIQLAGQPDGQVQTGVDGVPGDGSSLQVSNVHAMQEVAIVTNSNSAEFARAAYISLTTKGGNNQFHGRLAYWHQNSALSARNFFDAQKAKNLFHTMHTEISGPVIRNRTFFLFLWTGQRWPGSSYYLSTVPTAKMRQGDFTELLPKNVTIKDPLSGGPFPGAIVPANRINATTLKVMNQYLPAPNLGAPGALANNFGFLFPHPTDLFRNDAFEERVDQRITDNNTLYFRLLNGKSYYVLAGNYPAFTWTRVRSSINLVIADTHVFSPRLVNSSRFGIYRPNYTDGGTVSGVTPIKGDQVVKDLGIQDVNPKNLSGMGFPTMNISGYSAVDQRPGGVIQVQHNWDYSDSVTYATGRHVLKFGGEFRPLSNFSGQVPAGNYGTFSFTGSFATYAFTDFLLGLPYSSLRLNPLTNRTQLDSEVGLYAQETFKVNSRLNLDMGLRWDRFGGATYDDGLIYNWDPVTGNVIVPQSASNSISPLYPTKTIKVVTGQAQQIPSLRNFAPRIGAAYRPFGNKFVIRGGYGIYTETLGAYARAQGGGPFQLTETFFNSIQNGQPLFAMPNPFPPGTGSIPSQSATGFDPHTNNGHIHEFNFTLERQVHDIGFRLSYAGSRSRNMNYTIGLNKPQPSLTPFTASRRPYPQFVGASYAHNDGAMTFNSLTLEVQRKVGQITFDGHWAWASNYNSMQNLENPYAPRLWGRDPYTVRQRVVLNTIWNLPLGKGRRVLGNVPTALNPIISGWQLYWIAHLQTGQFFTPSFSGSDPSNTNTVGGLPDRVCNANLPADQRRLNRWFDPGCFVVPPAGRFGNSGYNVLEGPGLQLHDLTLGKSFVLRERFRFTFMAAAQNVLNHANFTNPSANISAPGSVGVISGVQGYAPGRQIMLRGRVDF